MISFTSCRSVLLFNSLTHPRQEVVNLHISDPNVEVTNSEGKVIVSQTDPYWKSSSEMSTDRYKVSSSEMSTDRYKVSSKERHLNVQHEIT